MTPFQDLNMESISSQELQEIVRDFEQGKLKEIEHSLATFITKNRDNILRFKNHYLEKIHKKEVNDELAIKLYIQQIRTINPQDDIKEQLEEIEREIWYTGERLKAPPNREEVAREWVKKYAPGWRFHKILTVIFVFEKFKDYFISLLHQTSEQNPENNK